ncbi:15180_t:CDS:1, partial [Cetraspora pellucida]
ENFNEEELETIINKISENLVEDDNLFDENKNKDENENEDKNKDNSFDLDNKKDETNLNYLFIAELIDLNFYNNNETKTDLFSNQ